MIRSAVPVLWYRHGEDLQDNIHKSALIDHVQVGPTGQPNHKREAIYDFSIHISDEKTPVLMFSLSACMHVVVWGWCSFLQGTVRGRPNPRTGCQ